jgi:nucleotide-binding universal stress UspA family protein
MSLDNLKTILVPTDFSEPAALALGTAVGLAQKFNANIEVFHVNVDAAMVVPPPLDVVSIPIDVTDILARAAERLERIASDVRRAGVTCTAATEVGTMHTEIVDRAQRIGAGLIVMGTHGRHGIGHAIMGSIAEKVVQHASCPVLVVPMRSVESPQTP